MISGVNVEEFLRRVDKEASYPNQWADDTELVSAFLIEEWIRELSQKTTRTPTTSNPKASLHSNITKELNAIYVAKNSDYGDAFGETYKKLGIISAVTRITDKVNRLQSLAIKSDEERLVKDESIVDTLLDLSNYAILTLIEMGYEPEVVEDSIDSPKVNICKDELTQDPFETNWEEARQNYDTNLKDVLESFVRVGYDMESKGEGIKAVELR